MEDTRAQLSLDVRLLGDLLGQTLKEQEGIKLFNQVETIRHLAKATPEANLASLLPLTEYFQKLSNRELLLITRAFTHFLNLTNIAEQHHRIRRISYHQSHPEAEPAPGSVAYCIALLLKKGIATEQISQVLSTLSIDLVLTAHPTEVLRRTLINKYNTIASILEKLDNPFLSAYERSVLHTQIHQEITAAWLTTDIRKTNPTPIDEVKSGLAIVENSLWYAIPQFMRELNYTVKKMLSISLPMSYCPIKFGSWMGGDRDGNPNVTPPITLQACWLNRWMAADLYLKELKRLRQELSMSRANAALRKKVGKVTEPYRYIIKPIELLLQKTKNNIENFLEDTSNTASFYYITVPEILEPLLLCFESLKDTGALIIAEGTLQDIIVRLYTFGVSLLSLDIREDASKHEACIAVYAAALGVNDYAGLPEPQKIQFLVQQLKNPNVAVGKHSQTLLTQDTFAIFEMITLLPRDSLHSYIISHTSAASDILVVYLLQKLAGVSDILPVVPLFETLADLQAAPQIMEALFQLPVYHQCIENNIQTVMIGYSDSAKDAGIFAASWAQYSAQENLVQIALQYGVQLIFFHGRGGSIGRGGWPTHLAIQAQPEGTIGNAYRVTEQGEVIRNKFGLTKIAERTFNIYMAATVEAIVDSKPRPSADWKNWMESAAQQSSVQYQQLIKHTPEVITYFTQATPIDALNHLAIGSRPQRRGEVKGVEGLRAIPWVFAWTQNRLLLSSWLGVGEALIVLNKHTCTQQWLKEWPYLYSLFNMIEMVLAKVSLPISEYYELRLVPTALHVTGHNLRTLFKTTVDQLLSNCKAKKLLEHNPSLRHSIEVRIPYILPLNLLQVELLHRKRMQAQNPGNEEESDINLALLVSINGIAAGMRNTG